MTKRTIILEVIDRVWHASHYIGLTPDPDIVRLFGTHTLPTPFTSRMPEADALAAIERHNPDAMVHLAIKRAS